MYIVFVLGLLDPSSLPESRKKASWSWNLKNILYFIQTCYQSLNMVYEDLCHDFLLH